MPLDTTSSEFQKKLLNNNLKTMSVSSQLLDINLEINKINDKINTISQTISTKNVENVITDIMSSLKTGNNDELKNLEDTVKNDLKNDIRELNKHKITLNEQICKKVFDAYKKSDKLFIGLNNNVKKLFKSKYLTQLKGYIHSIFSGTLLKRFKTTISSIFNWIYDKGKKIYNFFKYTLTSVVKIVEWTYNTAKKFIGFIYDKFAALAKVGWETISSVFEYITMPIKEVSSFLVDAINFLLESPIGFVLAVGGFVLAIKYVLPVILDYIIDFTNTIWGWIKKGVINMFFDGDELKYDQFVKIKTNQLDDFFTNVKTVMIKFYDDHIASWTGYDSKKIIGLFEEGGKISEAWKYITTAWDDLKTSNIFEDISIVWNWLQKVYDTIKDFNLFNLRKSDSKDARRWDTLYAENKKRFDSLIIQNLSDLTNSLVFDQLYKEYKNLKILGTNPAEISQNLMNKGSQILNSVKNNIALMGDPDLKKHYLANINVNLGKLVDIITTSSETRITNLSKEFDLKQIISSEIIQKLQKYLNDPAIFNLIDATRDDLTMLTSDSFKNQVGNKFNMLLTENTNKLNGTIDQISTDSAALVENLNSIFPNIQNKTSSLIASKGSMEELLKSLKLSKSKLYEIVKNGTNIEKYLQLNSPLYAKSTPSQQVLMIEEFRRLFEISKKTKITTSGEFAYDAIKDEWKMTQLSAQEIEARRKEKTKMVTDSWLDARRQHYATGGIVTGPINALIGEAGYPEVIFPLTDTGIKFIYDSMTDILSEKIYETENSHMSNNTQTNVNRIVKSKTNINDTKLFDMKNICCGVVGVVR